MIKIETNILPKLNGKYLYKSIRFIGLWVVLPIFLIFVILIIFFSEKLERFSNAFSLLF